MNDNDRLYPVEIYFVGTEEPLVLRSDKETFQSLKEDLDKGRTMDLRAKIGDTLVNTKNITHIELKRFY